MEALIDFMNNEKIDPETKLEMAFDASWNYASEITDKIVLSSKRFGFNHKWLVANNIKKVIRVLEPNYKGTKFMYKDIKYLWIPIEDNLNENIAKYFNVAYDFIEQDEGKVLVHCMQGVSRSPTIVISYLMKKMKMTYDEAYKMVKEKRPCIDPNIGFIQQLKSLI